MISRESKCMSVYLFSNSRNNSNFVKFLTGYQTTISDDLKLGTCDAA